VRLRDCPLSLNAWAVAATWIVKGNHKMEMEQHEYGSPLQELTEKVKAFIGEEAGGQPYSFILDAMMNAMVHIGSDARPDVSIPTILDFLIVGFAGLSGGSEKDGGGRRDRARPSLGSIYAHGAKAVVAIDRGMNHRLTKGTT
jgi:hypothetical protein